MTIIFAPKLSRGVFHFHSITLLWIMKYDFGIHGVEYRSRAVEGSVRWTSTFVWRAQKFFRLSTFEAKLPIPRPHLFLVNGNAILPHGQTVALNSLLTLLLECVKNSLLAQHLERTQTLIAFHQHLLHARCKTSLSSPGLRPMCPNWTIFLRPCSPKSALKRAPWWPLASFLLRHCPWQLPTCFWHSPSPYNVPQGSTGLGLPLPDSIFSPHPFFACSPATLVRLLEFKNTWPLPHRSFPPPLPYSLKNRTCAPRPGCLSLLPLLCLPPLHTTCYNLCISLIHLLSVSAQ